MNKKVMPQGVVLYRGPSNFDAKPIVVIATGLKKPSTNEKTGEMIQIYILADSDKPTDVYKQRLDATICGDCKYSSTEGRSCYVNLVYVNGVYRACMNGTYPVYQPEYHSSAFEGKRVRFGAYGDPAAVPFEVWQPLLDLIKHSGGKWTSYTHAWNYCDQRYREFCVASVDNPEEYQRAQAKGWRTYRVLLPEEQPTKKEFLCPASEEHQERTGRKLTCLECCACDGLNGRPNRGSAVIYVHGTQAKKGNYVKLRVQDELKKRK